MRRLMFVALAAAAFALPAAAQAAVPEPVMTGLDNPRGLAFGPEGGLYVAEAGRGGSGVCVPLPDGPGTRCYGATGAISRKWRGTQERIATGLPSLAGQPLGDTAAGPAAHLVPGPGRALRDHRVRRQPRQPYDRPSQWARVRLSHARSGFGTREAAGGRCGLRGCRQTPTACKSTAIPSACSHCRATA